jgi:hypothetical protein
LNRAQRETQNGTHPIHAELKLGLAFPGAFATPQEVKIPTLTSRKKSEVGIGLLSATLGWGSRIRNRGTTAGLHPADHRFAMVCSGRDDSV